MLEPQIRKLLVSDLQRRGVVDPPIVFPNTASLGTVANFVTGSAHPLAAVTDQQKVLGVVSDYDITSYIGARSSDPNPSINLQQTPVDGAVNKTFSWVTPNDTVDDVIQKLKTKGINKLVVVDTDDQQRPVKVLGFLDRRKLLREVESLLSSD